MDIREEIGKLNSKIEKLREVQNEIIFMEKWFTIRNGKERGKLKLYDYQQEFLVHIVEDKEAFYSRKTRQCGITTLYAMHVAYNINKYFRGCREKPLYLYVSHSYMEGNEFLKKVDGFLQCVAELDGSVIKEWILSGNNIKTIDGKYLVKIANGSKIKESTLGCKFDEIFVDEYEFIDEIDELYYLFISYGNKVIGTSSINTHGVNKLNRQIKQEIHWWQVPHLNKNLKWVKEVKEAIIDKEGNIVYDECRFRRFLEEGWKPTSPKYEKLLEAGLNEDELF